MRTKEDVWLQKEFQEAFVANERRERIRSGKVACALVVFLMPAGIILDRYVYPERWADFLLLRLLCSGLAAGLWALHNTSFGSRHYRFLGIPIALLPAFFISWMIGITEGTGVSLLCRTDFNTPRGQCHRTLEHGRIFARHRHAFSLLSGRLHTLEYRQGFGDILQQYLFFGSHRHYRRDRQLSLQSAPFSRVRPTLRIEPKQTKTRRDQSKTRGDGSNQKPLFRQYQS